MNILKSIKESILEFGSGWSTRIFSLADPSLGKYNTLQLAFYNRKI